MNIVLFALWGAVGWCGTPYPGWWRGPRPHPDPEPWLIGKLVGIVSGILGGWAYTWAFGPIDPVPWKSALPAAAACIGAFAVSRIVGDIFGRVAGGKTTAAGG